MDFLRGMRDKIGKYIDTDSEICVEMSINGTSVYGFCCFGVDKSGRLSDDRYMVFYNQTMSPGREITFIPEKPMEPGKHSAKFCIHLSKLPLDIDKLVFTASIDGDDTMGEIAAHHFYLCQNNTTQISMEVSGSDFGKEKAIISMEIYRKDEWRIASVAKGFYGGLSALLASLGGTEVSQAQGMEENIQAVQNQPDAEHRKEERAEMAQAQPDAEHRKSEEELTQEVMGKISLSKDKENLGKHVVNLNKCIVSLRKESGVDLGAVHAKVVVALDYSSSMRNLYINGTVQRTITRLVPLGLTFDNNGFIDVYLFQDSYLKLEDLTLSNYERYVDCVIAVSGYRMGGTWYAPVLRTIMEGNSYKQGGFLGFHRKVVTTEAIVGEEEPTFILFITDGENADKRETDKIIKESSGMNVFIQFIGIGNERFRYLQKLDEIPGRVRDHTGFSKMEDLDQADDRELYQNVLGQFSGWLKGLQ